MNPPANHYAVGKFELAFVRNPVGKTTSPIPEPTSHRLRFRIDGLCSLGYFVVQSDTAGDRMNTNMHYVGRRRSLWKTPALVAALFVSMLLLASHFTDGWNWPPRAFVVVGSFVFAIAFTYELITRNMNAFAYRAAVGIAFLAGFILMWGNFVQMADGNPSAGMHLAVPIVGIIAAAAARLRPKGMALALFITALAQLLVLTTALITLISRNPDVTSWTLPQLRGFAGNALFAMLFIGSAVLFRRAADRESASAAI